MRFQIVGLTVMLAVYSGIVLLLSLWTDRTLDFWLTYFKDTPINCPYWLSVLTTFFLSPIVFGCNFISEIADC